MPDRDRVFLAAKVEQVQGYLLTSPRLRQIRGGSALLVKLEREVRDTLEALHGEVRCAAGGILLAVFDDEDSARNGLDQVRRMVAKRAPAARLRGATSVWPSRTPFRDALRAALDLDAVAGVDGAGPLGLGPPPDLPFTVPCDICRARPAREVITHANQWLRACIDCLARSAADRQRARGASAEAGTKRAEVEQFLRKFEPREGGHRPATIDDLARGARPRGYVGYVAADGNGIGERLGELDTPEAYQDFSSALDEATLEALRSAVQACVVDAAEAEQQVNRLLPVLYGGDDLLLFCSPALAVPLAVAFARRFEELTAGDPRTKGRLGTGVGVVIAHASTPFGALDEAAHTLQKAAKRLARVHGGGSAVGFRVLHSGTQATPEQVRRGYFAGVGAFLLDDCETLLRLARGLRDSEPPWSRLRQIDALLRRDDLAVPDDLALLLGAPSMTGARTHLEQAMELPSGSRDSGSRPWRQTDDGYVTALPDLLALTELL